MIKNLRVIRQLKKPGLNLEVPMAQLVSFTIVLLPLAAISGVN